MVPAQGERCWCRAPSRRRSLLRCCSLPHSSGARGLWLAGLLIVLSAAAGTAQARSVLGAAAAARPPPPGKRPRKESWQALGGGPISAGKSQGLRLEFASNGTPLLASYGPFGQPTGSAVQTYTLNQPPRPDLPWPYLPPLPAPVDTLVDLALGPGNAPFIAFSEPNGTTHVLRHAALSWRPVGPQRALPAAPFILYPRLALGPQGQPFLCFPDYDAPGAAFAASCMFYDGFTWSYVGERGFTKWPLVGTRLPNLAVDSQNRPVLSYIVDGEYKGVTKTRQAEVQRYNYGSMRWEMLGGGPVSPQPATSSSMALSDEDVPFVSVVHDDTTATVVQQAGTGGWVSMGNTTFATLPAVPGVPGETLRVATHLALTGPLHRTPVVAFYARSYGDKGPFGPIVVKRFVGPPGEAGTWWATACGGAVATTYAATLDSSVSLAVDPKGVLHVAFATPGGTLVKRCISQ